MRKKYQCKQCESECILSAIDHNDGEIWDVKYLNGGLCPSSEWVEIDTEMKTQKSIISKNGDNENKEFIKHFKQKIKDGTLFDGMGLEHKDRATNISYKELIKNISNVIDKYTLDTKRITHNE